MNQNYYNIVVEDKRLLTGITLSSYGYSKPLKKLKKLKNIIEYNELKNNKKLRSDLNILTRLPPWKNLERDIVKSLISCFVVESTVLFPEQENYLNHCRKIWVPTSFCQKVLSEYSLCSELVPYCIDTPTRRRIPETANTFTFLISFDGKYSYERKGVIQGIKAFKKAFVENHVKLKIKTFELKKETEQVLIKEIGNDKRIYIDQTKLTNFEMIYDNVSCYVSPHRGEGFGRHIAESMFRELPVIVSNYGGPKDFCNEENSFLINKGGFVNHKGLCKQYDYSGLWFDPDIDEIAEKMLQVYKMDKTTLAFKSKEGAKTILDKYSCNAVQKNLSKFI